MASERKRVEGEQLGLLMSWVALKFTGEQIDPAALNPYRSGPVKSAGLRRIEEWQARRAFRAAVAPRG